MSLSWYFGRGFHRGFRWIENQRNIQRLKQLQSPVEIDRQLLREVRVLALNAALRRPIPQNWRTTIAKIDMVLGEE